MYWLYERSWSHCSVHCTLEGLVPLWMKGWWSVWNVADEMIPPRVRVRLERERPSPHELELFRCMRPAARHERGRGPRETPCKFQLRIKGPVFCCNLHLGLLPSSRWRRSLGAGTHEKKKKKGPGCLLVPRASLLLCHGQVGVCA